MELAIVVCLTDLGAKDEGDTYRENHVVEVRRALDHEVTENPYLTRQLSVFDDRQPVTGVPGTVFGGLRRTQELDGKHKEMNDLYWFGLSCRVIAFTFSRRVTFCVRLIV